MIYLITGALVIGAIAYLLLKSKKPINISEHENSITHKTEKEKAPLSNGIISYTNKLNKTKELYPFTKWKENFFEYDMEQYSEQNCNHAQAIFDNLIAKLISLGEHGNKKEKEKCFEIAVKSLNKLNEVDEGIIETGEREDLCELIDQIALAAGLIPEQYGEGEGIADLWREW
jgi:hypothetical protein